MVLFDPWLCAGRCLVKGWRTRHLAYYPDINATKSWTPKHGQTCGQSKASPQGAGNVGRTKRLVSQAWRREWGWLNGRAPYESPRVLWGLLGFRHSNTSQIYLKYRGWALALEMPEASWADEPLPSTLWQCCMICTSHARTESWVWAGEPRSQQRSWQPSWKSCPHRMSSVCWEERGQDLEGGLHKGRTTKVAPRGKQEMNLL